MKLRNKKTGEIGKLTYLNFEIDISEKEIDLTILLDNTGGECIDRQFYSLDELKKYLDEWEEYKPKEPLIKDEKIRKAVRAWADVDELSSALVYHSFFDTFLTFKSGVKIISFQVETPKELKFGKTYTITELCGEEEE